MVSTLTETFDAADLAAVRRLRRRRSREPSRPRAGSMRMDGSYGALACRARRPKPGGRAFSRTSFHERFGEATTPVLLFGAGHVGRAVVLALAPLPFTVRWIDGRAGPVSRNTCRRMPSPSAPTTPTHELAQAPRDAMVIVMTHSHPLDFDITAAALQRDAFDFVGLIGSETKRARFASWARQVGVAESRIDWLVCPIGMPQIRGKEPAVIAAGIAAQLLIARERASAPLVSPATQPA